MKKLKVLKVYAIILSRYENYLTFESEVLLSEDYRSSEVFG